MTLPLPTTVADPATQENHDRLAQQFPIQAQNIANGAVGTKAIAKASVTDEKLAKPTIVGSVKSSGAVEAGEGFTSEKTATGTYKVTLSTELATVGIILPVLLSGTEAQLALVGSAPAKKVFTVLTGTTAALKDGAFNFSIKAT